MRKHDVLLRELQHRVKNNLNIIASLLSLGASATGSDEARKVLTDARTRVRSMSEIYEQLYARPKLALDIDLSSYIQSLARSLFEAYEIEAGSIELVLEVERSTRIDAKRAVSLGLVVNELVSNALRHAWPGGARGRLRIGLSAREGRYLLSVEDDGVGIRAQAIEGGKGSLGLKIVRSLAKDLSAELALSVEAGTRVELSIPESPPPA